MTSKIYLINRDCDIVRLNTFAHQMHLMNLSFHRIEAYNAIHSDEKDLNRWRPQENDFYYIPRQLSKGEIGCFLSHRKCWEIIATSNDRGGFIFEDDVHFSCIATKLLSDDLWIPYNIDVIQLSTLKNEKYRIYSKVLFNIERKFQILQISDPILYGTQGYWISRNAAKNALKLSTVFREPVDNFLFDLRHEFCKENIVTHLSPAIVCRQENTTSTITAQRHNRASITNVLYEKKVNKILRKLSRKLKKRFIHTVHTPLLSLPNSNS